MSARKENVLKGLQLLEKYRTQLEGTDALALQGTVSNAIAAIRSSLFTAVLDIHETHITSLELSKDVHLIEETDRSRTGGPALMTSSDPLSNQDASRNVTSATNSPKESPNKLEVFAPVARVQRSISYANAVEVCSSSMDNADNVEKDFSDNTEIVNHFQVTYLESQETHPESKPLEAHPESESQKTLPESESQKAHHPESKSQEAHPESESKKAHPESGSQKEHYPESKSQEVHPESESKKAHPESGSQKAHPNTQETHPVQYRACYSSEEVCPESQKVSIEPEKLIPSKKEEILTIVIDKKSAGLGISISGGADKPLLNGSTGIYITKIIPGTLAAQDGRLKLGDQLLSVNGTSLESIKHNTAVQALKLTKVITLVVKRTEGQHGITAQSPLK